MGGKRSGKQRGRGERGEGGEEEVEVRWKMACLVGLHFSSLTPCLSPLHPLLTADLKNRLVKVKGHQGLR